MKLIELYVAEVGRRLPARQREDIQNELRSAIEDAVDDDARAQGKPADEALAAEVLRRYGAPEKTAASYLPPRYLIGPELFPKYVKVFGALVSVLALLAAIGFGASLGASPETRANIGAALLQAAAGLWLNVWRLAAIVTLVFGVYEWMARRLAAPPKAWDPALLKFTPPAGRDRINPVELTIEIVTTVAALLVFNLFPQWVGIYWLQGGHWLGAPLLAPAFFQYLPALNIWWGSQILLDLVILTQRRRQPAMLWLKMGLDVVRVLIFFQLVIGPALIQVDAATWAGLAAGAFDAQKLAAMNGALNTVVRVVLGIGTAVAALDLALDVVRRLVRGRVQLAL